MNAKSKYTFILIFLKQKIKVWLAWKDVIIVVQSETLAAILSGIPTFQFGTQSFSSKTTRTIILETPSFIVDPEFFLKTSKFFQEPLLSQRRPQDSKFYPGNNKLGSPIKIWWVSIENLGVSN